MLIYDIIKANGMAINFILLALMGLIIFFWAKEWVGIWALLPAILVVSMPNFIFENPLLSLSILLSLTSFFNFLLHPDAKNLIIAGVGLGAAQLVDKSNIVLLPYLIIVMLFFYSITLMRDWRHIADDNRFYKFKLKSLGYLRSLFFIFAISILVFFTVKLVLNFNFQETYYSTIYHFYDIIPSFPKHSFPELLSQPWPALILIVLSLVVFVFNLLRSTKKYSGLDYISSNFVELALALFLVFYWFLGPMITPIFTVIYILMAEPFKNLIITKNQKEIMIVIGHEKFSFSAKWIFLLVLILWHLINTVYLYSAQGYF